MATQRRKIISKQKLQIFKEADRHGIVRTLRKHNLSHSVFNCSRNAFNQVGVSSLRP